MTSRLWQASSLVLMLAPWLLIASTGSAAVAPPQSGQIRTDTTIGVANDRVSVSFDRKSGALLSLKNLATGDEYLKIGGSGGNPFRAYVDTTELPRVLRQGFPFPMPPLEDAMGGTLVDPAQCQLGETSFRRGGDSGVLRLSMQAAKPGLTFDLEVTVPDNDGAVNLQVTVRNGGDADHHVMMAAPYLTGLALGKDAAQNLGVSLAGFGQAGAPAWTNCGEVYGRVWGGQWNAVYDPASGESLGLIIQDKALDAKMFRRFPGGGMSVFYFNNRELKRGESVAYPTAQILVTRGSWRSVARRYHDWFTSAFQVRQHPDWFDDIDMFVGPWIPPAEAVAQAKVHPDAPGSFASFSQLPRLHLQDRYDLKEWAMYWEHHLTHCFGVFDFRSDLGGVEAFREGATRVERIGRHVGLYVATQSMRVDSPFFARYFPGTNPEDWLLMETPQTRITEKDADGGLWFYCCLRNKPWQDYLAGLCKRMVQQTGAKYIRLDEAGAAYMICHNPAHHHASPYAATGEMLEFYRKVRQAVDEVDPQVLIFTENPTDLLNLYCDGSLAMWNAGSEIAPMRLTNPAFGAFSYGLGQIESALQGYVPADTAPCGEAGWANGYHETLWGPGLVAKPKSLQTAPQQRPREFRWHELRDTFIDAVKRNDPTDIDPLGIGQDRGEWAARLWRSEKYWLMVCGNVAGIKPASPVRVKLPELPEAIQHAYEFDFETLAMREVPIVRDEQGIFVETINGFSAVFFPKPQCPPLVQMDDPPVLSNGKAMEVKLTAFAPWRSGSSPVQVHVAVPGLAVSSESTRLPAITTVSAPAQAEGGFYYIHVTGDCLRLKRWFRYEPQH